MKKIFLPMLEIIPTSVLASRCMSEISFTSSNRHSTPNHISSITTKINSMYIGENQTAVFANIYESRTAQYYISSQRIHLSISNFRKPTDQDDQSAHDLLINSINRLVPLSHPHDRGEEPKVRFQRVVQRNGLGPPLNRPRILPRWLPIANQCSQNILVIISPKSPKTDFISSTGIVILWCSDVGHPNY